MRTEPSGPIQAVILGTDAVLAARPAEPIQLARACQRAGFDFVAPVSWGEELLAARIANVVDERRPSTLVVAHCPFVAESLRARPPRAAALASVSPPVATARYLRAALPNHMVHVTYIGACPGASAPDIDDRMLPDVLLAWLVESGIDVQAQPRHMDGLLPPDRARHASMPGGVPWPGWLSSHNAAVALEATPITVDAVSAVGVDSSVVLDLGAACGCACAKDRAAAARLDPPRSDVPVVPPIAVDLTERRLIAGSAVVDVEGPAAVPMAQPVEARLRDLQATFLARGLSDVDALRAPEPLTTQRFSDSLEPWTAVPAPGDPADRPAPIAPVRHGDLARSRAPVATPPFTSPSSSHPMRDTQSPPPPVFKPER